MVKVSRLGHELTFDLKYYLFFGLIRLPDFIIFIRALFIWAVLLRNPGLTYLNKCGRRRPLCSYSRVSIPHVSEPTTSVSLLVG